MNLVDATGLRIHDLTVPQAGSNTLREIVSRGLRNLALRLLRLPRPVGVEGWDVFLGHVSRLARSAPGALFSALRQPSVGTLVRCLLDPSRTDIDHADLGQRLLHVLPLEAGEAWPAEPPPLDRAYTCWRSRVVVDASGERGKDDEGALFVRLDGDITLCRADDSPLALHEAHPTKHGNATSLGGQPLDAWTTSLTNAIAAVGVALPPLHAEMGLLLRQIVPVGFDAQRHVSASFRENVGTAYVSLHPHPRTMVEALVHEFSHNKLNALLELDPILENGFEPLYSSPVRPDPRPLHGVLLAVHAFVAVAAVYRGLSERGHPLAREKGFSQRYDAIVQKNLDGLQTLQNAMPTDVGSDLMSELRQVCHQR